MESNTTDWNANEVGLPRELYQLLAHPPRQISGPAAQSFLRAVRTELDAHEARAYASGWQDAVKALRGSPPDVAGRQEPVVHGTAHRGSTGPPQASDPLPESDDIAQNKSSNHISGRGVSPYGLRRR